MKSRGSYGKTLFPWKSKNGRELKKGLIQVIYLHGMHLCKGSRLPNIKTLEEKWKFIAEEFWKQPCCESLRLIEKFKDLQPPSHLSVRSEFGHILTEVSTAMHWGTDSLANLSNKDGDLPEYESLVLNILLEQEREKTGEDIKQHQENGKEKNEVSISSDAFSKSSVAELKILPNSSRKRRRENQSSDDSISSIGTSSCGSSKHCNNYKGKAITYFDKIIEVIEKQESKLVSTKPVIEIDLNENRKIEKLLLLYFKDIEWWQCLSIPNRMNEENNDLFQAKVIGIEVIVNVYCTKPNDLQFFKNEMKEMQLSYLASHKLFLKVRNAYEDIRASFKSSEKTFDNALITSSDK